MKNSDMPAMPAHYVYQDCGIDGNSGPVLTETINHGLTKREVFAMAAMQGLCAHDGPLNSTLDCQAAVRYADELIAELEKANITRGDKVIVRLASGEVVEERYIKPSNIKKYHRVTNRGDESECLLAGKHGDCRFVGPGAIIKPMEAS